jgi:hypothetical protein
MNQSEKKFFRPVLVLIVLIVLASVIYIFSSYQSEKSVTDHASGGSLNIIPEQEKTEIDAAKNVPKTLKVKFKTNEDIRREYGRLEVVYLFSGKRYEGAVVSIGEYYTIVTIGGVVKIPMNEVRSRDIIK